MKLINASKAQFHYYYYYYFYRNRNSVSSNLNIPSNQFNASWKNIITLHVRRFLLFIFIQTLFEERLVLIFKVAYNKSYSDNNRSHMHMKILDAKC